MYDLFLSPLVMASALRLMTPVLFAAMVVLSVTKRRYSALAWKALWRLPLSLPCMEAIPLKARMQDCCSVFFLQ